jgi:peptidoglycan/xylan/chitin deacetylase (PgdA/CDA1 family)
MLHRALGAVLVPIVLVATVHGQQASSVQRIEGGIVRGPESGRRLALVFTGHEFAEGADTILDVLARRKARASFFLTGTFLRDESKAAAIRRMVADGHYVGPHSDGHLLYCPWTGPKVTLVSRETFTTDLERNLEALERFGVARKDVTHFLPPYEWYNAEIAEWTRALGMALVNYTPGTRSNADYTEEASPQFVTSDAIYESILRRERDEPHGLNGFLLLLHVGAGPGRADKFHRRFDELTGTLAARGYEFVRVDTLVPAFSFQLSAFSFQLSASSCQLEIDTRSEVVAGVGRVERLVAEREVGDDVVGERHGERRPVEERRVHDLHAVQALLLQLMDAVLPIR